jgi:hypothetical protein
MHNRCRTLARLVLTAAAPVLLFSSLAGAQTPARPAAAAASAHPAAAAQAPVYTAPAPSEKDVAATQTEMIKLLRLSPTLTTVVSHDPSLLSNQEYVSHNNPQLAEFLARHPEVARNPEFYLFTHMDHGQGGGSDEALERKVWPDMAGELQDRNPTPFQGFINDLIPMMGFAFFLVALVWLVRVFLENRRWGRIFKLQSEVHGRLIEKFGTNQELALYMETEAGKRFLEASPIPVGFEQQQQMPNAVARVLTPIQIGIVLCLLGAGLLFLRHASAEMEIPMLVFGTVVLMPGVGFIISAGVTWLLASRLGLMPENPNGSNRNEPPYGSPNGSPNGSKDQQ